MLQSAGVAMHHHMANMRVARALKHAVPPAADQWFQPGDEVLIRREKVMNDRIGEYLDPSRVLGMDARKKMVYVQDVEIGNAPPFTTTQVKRYFPLEDIAHYFIYEISRGLRYFGSGEDEDSDVHLTEIIGSSDQ